MSSKIYPEFKGMNLKRDTKKKYVCCHCGRNEIKDGKCRNCGSKLINEIE